MKYPVGTVFIPHHPQFTGGVVVEHKGGKYLVKWDDGFCCDTYYSERKMDEIVRNMILTFRLPYTIGCDELFEI